MSARLSRRSLLAGLAAMPTLAIMGCEDDRTAAAPISTVDTLSFDNRLRIPALAESTVDDNGVRTFGLSRRRRIGRVSLRSIDTDLGLYRRSIRRRLSRPHLACSAG